MPVPDIPWEKDCFKIETVAAANNNDILEVRNLKKNMIMMRLQ